MSSADRKQDREFQLELLRIQLEHRRKVALFSTTMAVAISFLIFGVTIFVTTLSSEKEIQALLLPLAMEYMIVGIVLVIISFVFYHLVSQGEKNKIKTLRDNFIENDA